MIIPRYVNADFKIGDIIISLKEIDVKYCIFSKYHEFTITRTDSNYGYYIIDNECGIEINDRDLSKFTLKVDLECANKRYKHIENENNLKRFILSNCPYRFRDIEDRDYYDACELYTVPNNSCTYSPDCIKHIDKKLIQKNKEISTYLRAKKIKKIENK